LSSTRQAESLGGKLLVVALDFWEPDHRYPTGHYVRTLGVVGDTNAESEAILMEHEVNTAPFSAQVRSPEGALPMACSLWLADASEGGGAPSMDTE
jgi:exosome complex exonuclease DIS3/RRP44